MTREGLLMLVLTVATGFQHVCTLFRSAAPRNPHGVAPRSPLRAAQPDLSEWAGAELASTDAVGIARWQAP